MKDLLIVGFGLAGLSIAKHAEDENLSFNIIADQSQKSSRVAGGIINPVAVKRMKPVWRVERFLPYAKSYYLDLEKRLYTSIYQDILLQVYIHNTVQENNWFESYDKPRIKPFLNPKIKRDSSSILKSQRFGLINAGLVNLSKLFSLSMNYYIKQEKMINQSFQYGKIKFITEGIQYKSEIYRNIVFCEGFGVTQNPYFNDLGIYGNKGDYLILKSDKLQLKDIAKAKYFLIPLGNDLYKFGATYQRSPLNHQPSDVAKSQMVEALENMINVPYEIVDQVCGIRPTTKDRHPIIGTHQKHSRMHILNGFGSRGVMTSPLLGKELLSHIFDAQEIDPEVSIQRIYART